MYVIGVNIIKRKRRKVMGYAKHIEKNWIVIIVVEDADIIIRGWKEVRRNWIEFS